MAKKKIYVVRKGRKTGIFNTWLECESHVSGYNGAEYKSFKESERELAEKYLQGDNSISNNKNIYVVRVGREVGIYNTCEQCLEQVKGYKGAEYKKFKASERELADRYLHGENVERKSVEGLTPKEEMELTLEKAKEEGTIVIYTDGSFEGDKYAYGYLQVKGNGEIGFTVSGVDSNSGKNKIRNIAGEMEGVLKATENVLNHTDFNKIVFFVDYVGLKNWVKNIWAANNEYTQKYKEQMQNYAQQLDIDFVVVKGHTKNKYNKKADELARKALNLN